MHAAWCRCSVLMQLHAHGAGRQWRLPGRFCLNGQPVTAPPPCPGDVARRTAYRRSAVRGAHSTRVAAAAQESILPAQPATTKRLVFLGTPDVAASVLNTLLDAAALPDAGFHVAAVVSQPGKPRGRGRSVPGADAPPSPVAQCALDRGVPADLVLTPRDAKDAAFLDALRALRPDVCVTAAYGHYLPGAFLDIPPCGTVNIHPSLLPKYRGAAPVQRALQAGESMSGCTVLYTVKAMDAGPIIAQEAVSVSPDAQHVPLLTDLFALGTRLLLRHMPAILDGSARAAARAQDESGVIHAPKIDAEEGLLSFNCTAKRLHDTVRAFQGWPGTRTTLFVEGGEPGGITVKVLASRVGAPAGSSGDVHLVRVSKDALHITCDDGSVLDVLQLQVPGGKPMSAAAYVAGLRGKQLRRAAATQTMA